VSAADHFAGCIVGQAVGDAMGFIMEGDSPASCASYVDRVLRPRNLLGQSRGQFPIGQYSDDTQLARELILSFLARDGFDPADYASRIASLFMEDRIVGRGRATQAAAHRIAKGVPWHQAGTAAPAAGNGSAMRAAPVGLLFAHDHQAMIRAAHDQGRITHADPRCSAGAIAIAGATAIVLREDRLDSRSLCARLSEWVRHFDPELTEALERLPSWISKPPDEAIQWVRQVGVQPAYTGGWEGVSPFVTGSVLWSLYSFLRSPDDYWEAICTAIGVGGDVDTTAAMTGAIAGTRVGLSEIPTDATRLITDRGTWEWADLVRLAHELHRVHASTAARS
jgi:ADP-ribosylglycohydrolase